MNPLLLCWNGINQSDVHDNTAFVAQAARHAGRQAHFVRYRKVRWWESWDKKLQWSIAETLAENQTYPDDIVVHSYGALIAFRMMELGVKFRHVFFVAPAIDSRTYIPEECYETLTVFYNPFDLAILAASALPRHKFGAMGRAGYLGPNKDSPRIENIKMSSLNFISRDPWNHSFYFRGWGLDKVVHTVLTKTEG